MDNIDDRDESLARLRELIADIRIAFLTTMDEDGLLHSRPMATQAMDEEGVLWFFTSDYTPKVHDVLLHKQCGLMYALPEKNRYVSICGHAELVRDPETLKRLWKPALQAWFPKGLDDPNLALLKVEMENAQYWDASSSKLVQLYQAVKAFATGKSAADSGETAKLTIKHRIGSDTAT